MTVNFHLNARYQAGVNSGQLSNGEQTLCKEAKAAYQEKKESFKSDGKLSLSERMDLLTDRAQASNRLFALKHNNITA